MRISRRAWWIGGWAGGLLLLLVAAAIFYWDDILATGLDPKVPFPLYRPPPAPDYAQRAAWALHPGPPAAQAADVFFVHPTTYDGGSQWLGPIPHARTDRLLYETMLPNYAGPFARVGRVFAPRYRHASLYALMRPHRDDAREAQEFAYGDVRAAFQRYITAENHGRPFFIVGVEQGGTHAARLLRDEIATNPGVRARLVAVYLVEAVVPADEYGPNAPTPACVRTDDTHCVMAWASVEGADLAHARRLIDDSLTWRRRRLVRLEGRQPLCINPMLGRQGQDVARARLNLGAANATGLEWGIRPAFLVRQVSARCENGLLRVTRPRSASLRRAGVWAESLMVPGYNLFYANVEADAQRRLAAIRPLSASPPPSSRTAPAAP